MSVSYDLWWGVTAQPGLRGIVAYRLPRDVAYKLSISVAMQGLGVYMLPRKRLALEDALSTLMGEPCHVVIERKAKG